MGSPVLGCSIRIKSKTYVCSVTQQDAYVVWETIGIKVGVSPLTGTPCFFSLELWAHQSRGPCHQRKHTFTRGHIRGNIELQATTSSRTLRAPCALGPQEPKGVTILAGVIGPNR